MGTVTYNPTLNERAGLRFRRSLFVVEDIQLGEVFSNQNVRCIRPGH
jgi:sialic acid synthase SpsE